MKVAVVGSRNLHIDDMRFYIPAVTTEIVSGGAKGVDKFARELAIKKNLEYTEFLPEYEKYGRAAPLKRNNEIIDYADIVVAIWDGKSKGTKYTTDRCKKTNKSLIIYYVTDDEKGLDEIYDCEYINLEFLGVEPLKKTIIAELDGETDTDIDIGLIDACVDAILINKRTAIITHTEKETLDKNQIDVNDFVEKIIRKVDIDDNIKT